MIYCVKGAAFWASLVAAAVVCYLAVNWIPAVVTLTGLAILIAWVTGLFMEDL